MVRGRLFVYVVSNTGLGTTCSRARPGRIKRHVQMRISVIDNQEGPLSRSVANSMPKLPAQTASNLPFGVQERICNLEDYLGVDRKYSASISQRLAILEARLEEIEQIIPWPLIERRNNLES